MIQTEVIGELQNLFRKAKCKVNVDGTAICPRCLMDTLAHVIAAAAVTSTTNGEETQEAIGYFIHSLQEELNALQPHTREKSHAH